MIEALLFDVGEVLIRLDPTRLTAALSATEESSKGDTLHNLGSWEPYDRFERGSIGSLEFFEAAKIKLGRVVSWEAFLELWDSVLVEECAGVKPLLERLRKRYRLFGLSNSNPLHIDYAMRKFPCLSQLERLFTSYEIGARKPEKKAFDFVLHQIKIPAGRVLFFDDRPENVEAARALGMVAELVVSSESDLERSLKKHGVLY